jgi:Ca2+-binding EF-hand superfamily protein
MNSEEEDETRLRALFHKLDVDGNGRIDTKDLHHALTARGHTSPLELARVRHPLNTININTRR